MLEAFRRTFGTIRWKLTSSYVAVTLLATLALEAILVISAIWSVFNSIIVPKNMAQAGSIFALALRSEYEARNRRPQVLADQLWLLITPAEQPEQRNPLQFDIAIPKTIDDAAHEITIKADRPAAWQVPAIVLLDSQGRVITATLQDVYQPGAPITQIEMPEAKKVIDEALRTGAAGKSDASSAWSDQGWQPLAASPVISRNGRLVGVIYVRAPRPPIFAIVRNISTVLRLSFLPILVMSAIVGLGFGLLAGLGITRRLKRLTAASAGLAGGDLSQRVADTSADEIGQLSRQFNTMANQLDESVRSLRRLADQNAQLAEQATQLATVEERNRLARDLHDSVSQELFSLTMLGAAAQRLLNRNPVAAAAQLDELQSTAQRALQETRSLIFALRPAMLGDRGLGAALRDLVGAVGDRQGLQVNLAISGERRLPLEHEQALFRIVQEALANVVRHSGVRAAIVLLQYEKHYIYLEVSDPGKGFDPSTPRSPRCIGLESMAERAAALSGTFTIDSRASHGTIVTVTLPVTPP